jgi:hypothetical protein
VNDTAADSTIAITAYSSDIDEEYLAMQLDNNLGVEVKQRFENGMDYSAKYRMVWQNDFSDYPDTTEMDNGDSWTHELTLRHGFKVKKSVKNRASLTLKYKVENSDSLHSPSVKISDNVRITVIPRLLTVNLKGDYTWRRDHEYDPELADPWFYTRYRMYGAEAEGKYSITSKLAATLMLRYENTYDENDGAENYSAKIGGLFVTYLF